MSGLAYGLSVVCEKGSRGLKEIRSFSSKTSFWQPRMNYFPSRSQLMFMQHSSRPLLVTFHFCHAAGKELREFLSHAKSEERVAITGSVWTDEPIKNSIDGKSSVANKVSPVLVP